MRRATRDMMRAELQNAHAHRTGKELDDKIVARAREAYKRMVAWREASASRKGHMGAYKGLSADEILEEEGIDFAADPVLWQRYVDRITG